MLGFNRPTDLKDGTKPALKPALYDPPLAQGKSAPASQAAPRAATTAAPLARDPRGAAVPPSPEVVAPANASVAEAAVPVLTDAPGSKLFIGVNIKLKGVEISDCDVLVIEGQVDATVHSKLMEIARPGTLHGTALIDVAEIRGEFAGELTARTRLVVHGTGRVSGTIRYGKLIVAEGGEVSGDVKAVNESQPTDSVAALDLPKSRDLPPAAESRTPGLPWGR